ncbi:acyl-CoA thioesterase [Rubrivirga sp. IMCC43871]|uniref:acyl-CoA thioesterase n=1 Tax=Rubrivirga sp. IMCC43871 TaxID=3391575 RepID=UPI00398FAC17
MPDDRPTPTFTHLHRVRYRECDPMGVVYHSHVLDWFEAARTEALREAGLPYRALEESGVIMPVVDLAVRYHASVLYDDLVEIEASFPSLGVRLPIDYAVRRQGEDAVLISGRVTLCFIDRERQRPVGPPQAVRDALAS